MSKIKLSKSFINDRVKLALTEDLYPDGDVTSDLLQNNKIVTAKIISNQKAIIAGLSFAKQVFATNWHTFIFSENSQGPGIFSIVRKGPFFVLIIKRSAMRLSMLFL